MQFCSSLYFREDFMAFITLDEFDIVEPITVKEAMEKEDAEEYVESYVKELNNLKKNGTYTLQVTPEEKKPISSKCVFKRKLDGEGHIASYKSRIVGKGYLQVPGVDFNEVFASVTNMPSTRIILTLAAKDDMDVEQMDIDGAYLVADLKEEIWMVARDVCRTHR